MVINLAGKFKKGQIFGVLTWIALIGKLKKGVRSLKQVKREAHG